MMKPIDDLERRLGQSPVKLNLEADEAVLNDLCDRLDRTAGVQPVYPIGPIGVAKLAKLAVAAAIVVAAVLGIAHFGASLDGANVAWADVVRHIEQVDHLHFYHIETRENGSSSIREGWYAQGKIKTQLFDADQSVDNGARWAVVDEHNNVIKQGKSRLAAYNNIFDALTTDMLSYRSSQFVDNTPVSIGSDFLLYEFDPQGAKAAWIDKITVMVGRNSLMPVQIKTYYKRKKWSMNHLLVCDYEAPEKPTSFFAMPTLAKPPHGLGRVVLGGEEVVVELKNAPGVNKAIVRLHAESKGSAKNWLAKYRQKKPGIGKPAAFAEITFVTDEQDRSYTENLPLWPNKGMKAVSKVMKTRPDNQYHYIVYTPVLIATDEANVFQLQLSCWLKTKQIDL